MYPGTAGAHASADLERWIESAGIDVARLDADDRRAVDRWQAVGTHATLGVDGHSSHAIASQPKDPESLEQGRVRLLSNLVDFDADTIESGMPVELVWEDMSADLAIPRFRPCG